MNLYSLIFLLTIASFTPGPNNLLASYSGLNFGFKRTLPLIHGVALGWGSILILLCAGLIIIFQKYNFLQLYLKIFGSIFLLYMSYKIAINSSLDNQKSTNPITFTKMFFFQYINPKGVLMSVVIISSFIDINSNYLYDAIILILLGILFAYSSIISWCLFGSLIRKFLNNKNKIKIFNYCMSLALAGCVIMIWKV